MNKKMYILIRLSRRPQFNANRWYCLEFVERSDRN